MAYGYLELKPAEFFELTPREFTLMYKGWKQREERKARYVQWLISPHTGKKTPSLEKITGFAVEPDDNGDSGDSGNGKRVPREEQDRVLDELRKEILR